MPAVGTCALCAQQCPEDNAYDVLSRNVYFVVSQQRSIQDKLVENIFTPLVKQTLQRRGAILALQPFLEFDFIKSATQTVRYMMTVHFYTQYIFEYCLEIITNMTKKTTNISPWMLNFPDDCALGSHLKEK